ncbi:docking protein 2 [Cololabis saira]|uniref:docking protein 2 n=1 Tax=Cololabis saira TaxID=129043 RepID=UPI002AD5276B|nr:docking protein 2 [Cololabis saira]
MEEDIRKQGILFHQQQRFGKKWKRVWCVLYRESSCSISRLEFFECKDGGNMNEKTLRKQQENKKVIRLADCIRVTEVEMDGCPKETGSFLVETTEKIYMFAADRSQLDDWTHKLCEIAFPMKWLEPTGKRGSLQRTSKVEDDEGMEDNSLYSGRKTVHDFRVCVRRTDASERCRLKGDGILRANMDGLHLMEKTGEVLFAWPYRYLRRFGRDKTTFSFEAGRRCDSGEGSFEFDTKQGNLLFQAVEGAISLQKTAPPQRQTSGGGPMSPDTPQNMNPGPALPHSRMPLPPPQPPPHSQVPQAFAAQAADFVYSTVSEAPHREHESPTPSQQQQRPLLSHLEPPVDKMLTGVRSLNLDSRGLPVSRKNQVKMISSCPLPDPGFESCPGLAQNPSPTPNRRHSPKLGSNQNNEQMYSQITLSSTGQSVKKKTGSAAPSFTKEPEYSLPFDTIALNVMSDILQADQGLGGEAGADPLYDSIDETKIRNIFRNESKTHEPAYRKADHIYDDPEGCAAAVAPQRPDLAVGVYDDPEEMKGDAWKIMGTTADPVGHEYPYNARVDDYAVPKRTMRACPPQNSAEKNQDGQEEEAEEEREEQTDDRDDSPYNNLKLKMV